LDDERVVWFPIKHFSPTCAWHVGELIRELKPAAVLVEGPDDANDQVQHVVHPETWPPLTVFSTYVDKKNVYGLNGVLSPNEESPARFRGWWPLTAYSPEYVALKAGHEVGAKLTFIDVPLTATIPHHHVPNQEANQVINDRHLAQSAYFEALRQTQRRRSFEEFWNANFEVGGWELETREFMKRVLTFAWCARNVGSHDEALEADGTLLREGHMRDHVERALKEHPGQKIVVVTGAFHSVALPWTKKAKAKAKVDKDLETLITSHSFRALSNLYKLNRLPGYHQLVWEQLEAHSAEPFNQAAMQLLIEVMRRARSSGVGLSTADSVGSYQAARQLAHLRRNPETTLEDLHDAVRMGYVKGDYRIRGPEIERAMRDTLIGNKLGRVTSAAGQAPLMRDFYDQCRVHKVDLSGVAKEVRCDLHKQDSHKLKSAFFHQLMYLDVPLFADVVEVATSHTGYHSYKSKAKYRGPDLATGEGMELIIERWGVQWREGVDDRLLEISDRGASLAHAATTLLKERLVDARGNAEDTTKLLLRTAQMMLTDLFDEMLSAVEDAAVVDSDFGHLVKALADFVVLHSYRDTAATQGLERVLNTIVTVFNKACIVLPMIANASEDQAPDLLAHLQTLVRITLTFEGVMLDRQLLIEKIQEMVQDLQGAPNIRGAGFGILFSFGATREKIVAREMSSYLLGSPDRVVQAGSFLDGLFMSSKNIFMGSPRLLRAINEVLRDLDWDTFKIILPDLRRAFTQFIPSEIDNISVRVSEEIGLDEPPSPDAPIPDILAKLGAQADARAREALVGWV
jgi:hypothetical protein